MAASRSLVHRRPVSAGDAAFLLVVALLLVAAWYALGASVQRRALEAWRGDYLAARVYSDTPAPRHAAAREFARAYDSLSASSAFSAAVHWWRADDARKAWLTGR